jgi:ubiquinone/menaquinone biosynthesis C-methylase UbiE
MAARVIRFEDGASYERLMGTWSRLAAPLFIRWVDPPPGLRWIDVGCGNGAFTSMLCAHCAPAAVTGVDPSPGQLAYARSRPDTPRATFLEGDAMALPVADASFGAAAMALSLFFVPDAPRGVAELARALKAGGLAAAYNWDIPGGGVPMAPLAGEMRDMGFPTPLPPSVDTSRAERMSELWEDAGFEGVQTTRIEVQRSFDSFEHWWEVTLLGTAGVVVREQPPEVQSELKERLRRKMPADAQGRITWKSWANAVKGRKP